MTSLVKSSALEVQPNGVVLGKVDGVSDNALFLYNTNKAEPKIKEFSKQDPRNKTLDEVIAYWAYGLGIDISAKDIFSTGEFLKENFGNLNCADLKICVKMVLTDSQFLDLSFNHYGKLSFVYVSKILNSYIQYKNSTLFDVSRAIEKATEKPIAPPTPEERLENFKILLKNAKEDVTAGHDFYDYNSSIFAFLKKNRLIDLSIETNKDQIDKAIEYAERMFEKNELNKTTKSTSSLVINLPREQFLSVHKMRYFSNQWLEKTDVNKFVLSIKPEMLP